MRIRGGALHTMVGAYVMDALPAAERTAFERHLLRCDQCRDDAKGLREATARLASAAAVPPPPDLREQTMTAAARTRQLPPALPGQQERSPGGSGSGHRWLTAAAVAVVVVLAGTAAVLGLHASAMQHKLSAAEQRDSAIAAVLGAQDTTTLTARIQTGGMATVVMSHRARALVFIASGLTSLPPSKAYELWLMSPAGDTSAGMLRGYHGMAGPMVVGQLGPGDKLALTVESAAGSRQPTSAPIVLVTLGD